MNDKIYSINEIKEKINENENYFRNEYNVSKFLLFGSYAKGKQTSQSDIDLLVDFESVIDMFKFLELQEYLQKIFNKKVDLGTKNGLKKFVKQKILSEAIAL